MTEKQHKPSTTRLRRAREKGDIGVSREVPSVVGFVLALVAMTTVVVPLVNHIGALLTELLREPWRSDSDVVGQAMVRFLDPGLWALVFAIPVAYALGAAAGTFMQTRGLITFAQVEFKAENIDPAAGFKRIFSLRSVVSFVRFAIKALACAGLMAGVLWGFGASIAKLGFSDVSLIAPVAWTAFVRLLGAAAVLYVASAVFDIWYEHFEYIRRNKMSDEEVKQERKDQHGDPEVRKERRALQREGARGGSLKEMVQFAALVITGPGPVLALIGFGKTEAGPALMLLKKGRGEATESLRAEAVRQGKPFTADAALAKAIYERVADNALIPEPLSTDIFAILSALPKG